MLHIFAVIFAFQFASISQASTPVATPYLKPFATDGCTGFVNGPPGRSNLWLHCCHEHDLRYWFGGSNDDIAFTDLQLRACVEKAAGATWADIIYRGVQLGHQSPVRHPTHWSWAWVPERRDGPLTANEVDYVKFELRKLPMNATYIESFIKTYLD